MSYLDPFELIFPHSFDSSRFGWLFGFSLLLEDEMRGLLWGVESIEVLAVPMVVRVFFSASVCPGGFLHETQRDKKGRLWGRISQQLRCRMAWYFYPFDGRFNGESICVGEKGSDDSESKDNTADDHEIHGAKQGKFASSRR